MWTAWPDLAHLLYSADQATQQNQENTEGWNPEQAYLRTTRGSSLLLSS